MRYEKGKYYTHAPFVVKCVGVFCHRGTIYRFVYHNGSCFDLQPGESLNGGSEVSEPTDWVQR